LMLFFLIVVVTDCGALIDASQPIGGPGLVEHGFGQRGLAAATVPQQNDVTNVASIGHFLTSKTVFLSSCLVEIYANPSQYTGCPAENKEFFAGFPSG
jgi:hypothetical protein